MMFEEFVYRKDNRGKAFRKKGQQRQGIQEERTTEARHTERKDNRGKAYRKKGQQRQGIQKERTTEARHT